MHLDSANAKQVAALRRELLVWNRIDQLQARGEPPADFLKTELKYSSLKTLLDELTTRVGPDDRVNYSATLSTVQAAIESVGLICSSDDLIEPTSQNPNWRLSSTSFLCSKQNFSDEPSLLSRGSTPATGFLVGTAGRYLLTASHVAINRGKFNSDLYCVFGFRMGAAGAVISYPPSDVVAIESLVTLGGGDWALVELATPVGRAGLPLRSSGTPSVSDSVIAIGYPYGMPVKAGPGTIRDVSAAQYKADLDISPGNSGSPVIAMDANGNPSFVEGIVATALPGDLTYVYKTGCLVWSPSCAQDDKDCWPGFVPIAKVLAEPLFVKTVFP